MYTYLFGKFNFTILKNPFLEYFNFTMNYIYHIQCYLTMSYFKEILKELLHSYFTSLFSVKSKNIIAMFIFAI